MDLDKIREKLDKIPFMAFLGIFLGYLGYQLYMFYNDPSSPLLMKQTQIKSIRADIKTTEQKLQKARDFFRSLDVKREVLRSLAVQLAEMKGTMSESLDIGSFIRQVSTEARKIGLVIRSIEPQTEKRYKLYHEQPFEVEFRGVFLQFLVFLDRIANFKKVARVDRFEVKPIGAGNERFVALNGKMTISVFKYAGSEADAIAGKQSKGSGK